MNSRERGATDAAVNSETSPRAARAPDGAGAMSGHHCPPVMFEMLRSLATLAETLNLAHAVAALGISRQTIRRHIGTLEALQSRRFFEIKDRQYRLTEAGREAAAEARHLLSQAESWLDGRYEHVPGAGGLDRSSLRSASGHDFLAQQHPLSRLWVDGPPLLQTGFLAWANARFQLDAPEMDAIRPYLLLYRAYAEGWICAGIGEKSSYASWFEPAWAKSAIGRLSRDDPAGPEYNEFTAKAHAQILGEGGVRLDHVYARIARKRGGGPQPVSFQRLLLGCLFPDGEPALAVLVARTNRVAIDGLDLTKAGAMPEDLAMEFEV